MTTTSVTKIYLPFTSPSCFFNSYKKREKKENKKKSSIININFTLTFVTSSFPGLFIFSHISSAFFFSPDVSPATGSNYMKNANKWAKAQERLHKISPTEFLCHHNAKIQPMFFMSLCGNSETQISYWLNKNPVFTCSKPTMKTI